jgi:hypothetical protein
MSAEAVGRRHWIGQQDELGHKRIMNNDSVPLRWGKIIQYHKISRP